MTQWPTSSKGARPLMLALVAMLVLVLRALVPAGWMPAFGDGSVRVDYCSGARTMSEAALTPQQRDILVALGEVHDRKSDPPTSDGDPPCPFHGQALVLFENGVGPSLDAPKPAESPIPPLRHVSVGRGLPAPPPPATGPPLTA